VDLYGDGWDVREYRPTPGGWPLAIGWPSGFARGRGGIGGPRAILTRELVDHMEAVRHHLRPIEAAAIPIGRSAVKRLRRLLGHDRKADRRDWWVGHAEELATTPFAEFGRKYGVSSSAAEAMHGELFGRKRGRKAAWWREPEATALLLSDLPTVEIADRLGRSAQEVWGSRYLLKSNKHETGEDDGNDRD